MAEVEKVLFKVEGMVKRGSITWMGWPKAIVSALEGMEGIRNIVYLADKEAFELNYIPSVIPLKGIFDKIEALGKGRNPPYNASLEGLTKTEKGR